MIVTPLRPDEIPEAWDWVSVLLEQAIARDEVFDADEIYARLCSGDMAALVFEGEANGVVVYAIGTRDDMSVMFLPYLGGRIDGGPKQRLRTMRQIEAAFETEARRLGCAEMRGGGRNWHRIFPGWERTDYGVRKVLAADVQD